MSARDNTKQDTSSLQGSYAYTDTLKGIYYGSGSLKTALPKLLDSLGTKKALIVTGKSLHNKTDVVRKVEKVLKDRDAYAATFYEIGEHSPIAGIKKGIQVFKNSGADVIISVGGGSVIDASKVIIHMIQKDSKESGATLYKQIAIPTTLSAAEYTHAAGYTDEQGQRAGAIAPGLAPSGIILDAELTLATPERLWLSTGIRALGHAVENIYKPFIPHPIKVLCYGAIADLFKYLPESKASSKDLSIRQRLQLASWMSQWPLKLEKSGAAGLSHRLGQKLGAPYSIPHGITSCLTLAPVVAMRADNASQEDKEATFTALFYLRQQSTNSAEADIRKFAADIDGLVTSLGLKSNFAEYKVPATDVPKIAAGALGKNHGAEFRKIVKMLEGL